MQPIVLTIGPLAAASANNIALSQTPTSGTALTLNGAAASGGVATLDVARRVLLTYGNEASARTLRITGTNADKNPIRETLTVPSGAGGTVATIQDFLTVTEAMPLGGGWTAAATLGTNAIASTSWKLLNSSNQSCSEFTFVGTILAGLPATGSWSIEWTLTQLNDNANQIGGALGNYPTPPTPIALTVLMNRTANAYASVDNPMVAWRTVINNAGDTTFQLQIRALEGGVTESR